MISLQPAVAIIVVPHVGDRPWRHEMVIIGLFLHMRSYKPSNLQLSILILMIPYGKTSMVITQQIKRGQVGLRKLLPLTQ